MGMSVGDSDSSMVDLNTTPLIDVMLVLLIMFIITIPVMTHAVKLDMPRPPPANPNPPPPPEIVQLEIDFDGTIYWNGNAVTLEVLEAYMRRSAAQVPQPEIHLRPNKRAKYEIVAKVLGSAQRNDVTKIGFAGNEQFMD